MGLDWLPLFKARPGVDAARFRALREQRDHAWHAARKAGWATGWFRRRQLAQLDAELSPLQVAPEETAGSPRIGVDQRATDYVAALHAREGSAGATSETLESVLSRVHRQFVVSLAPASDGNQSVGLVPEEPLSFRAQLLERCERVIGPKLLEEAWEDKAADQLTGYADRLLAAATAYAESQGRKLELERLWAIEVKTLIQSDMHFEGTEAQYEAAAMALQGALESERQGTPPSRSQEDPPALTIRSKEILADDAALAITVRASRWCRYWGEHGHDVKAWF